MKHRSHCHDCALAEWATTPTGRPSKAEPGKCLWTKRVAVPPVFAADLPQMPDQKTIATEVILTARYAIWWNDAVVCPVYRKRQDND